MRAREILEHLPSAPYETASSQSCLKAQASAGAQPTKKSKQSTALLTDIKFLLCSQKSTAQTNEAHYNIQKYFTEEYTMSKQ